MLPVTAPAEAARDTMVAAIADDPAGSAPWAVVQAKKSGQRVAVPAEQSEARDVYANPDGSFTAELRTVPVRVRRGAGWVPVDTTLRVRAGGGVEPAATTVPVVFSGGGDQPLVRLGEDAARIELRWPKPLPDPVLSRDSINYPEVLRGVDLRKTATAQGFTEVLVVKNREAARNPELSKLTFGLDTRGVSVRDDGDGNIAVYDAKGEQVFGSGAPMVWDSTPSAAKRAVGALELGKKALVLRPDRKLLDDPAATFPVFIDPDFAAGRTGFALALSGHPSQAYWGGDGENLAKVGLCDWAGCNGIGVARSYFQFDASFMVGKHVLGAEFNVFENYAPSCSARAVEAWGTNPVGGGTTWNNQPFPGGGPVALGTANVAHGYSASCPGAWVGFNATGAVNAAVTYNNGATAIMLKAADEGDKFAWKKFSTNPSLVITYNSYPGAPTGQTVENASCAVQPNEPYANPHIDNDPSKGPRGPKLSAVVADPDGGLVQAQFEWYTRFGAQLGGSATEFKSSGSAFTVDVPAAHAGDGAKLAYRVRGADGVDFGPWGPWCDVTIDRKAPDKTPKVSSVTYPECPPPDYDPCDRGGGVGRTGGFTLGADGVEDVAGFEYYLYGQEGYSSVKTSSGSANVLVTPPEDGPMDLYARSVDKAGDVGPEYRYHFWAGPGTPPNGHWKLDGYAEPAVVDDSRNAHHGTFTKGPAKWAPGRHGDALWLDGATGYVSTEGGSTVDTSKSFSVSAWVKLDRLDTDWRTAVSQSGSTISGFFLQYNPNVKKWHFVLPATNADTAARDVAESAGPAVAGRWTHLVGMYDAAAKKIRIYVDGVPGTTGDHLTPWKATGSVQLGRAQVGGQAVNYWPGSLDEVRVYDRALTLDEIHDLAGSPATEEVFLPLDEGTGTTAQDVSGNYRLGTLGAAASWTTGKVGTGAVMFGGGTETLSTTGPALRTDAGFTVTAWVKLDADDGQVRTVLSQDAVQGSGFQLRYDGGKRKWSFALPQSATDTQLALSVEPGDSAQAGVWTHLAGVYDPAAQEIQLYVDGVKAGWKKVTATVNATGALQVGRGRQAGAPATPFAGAIDDVHAWTGVRTADQIKAEYQKPITRRNVPYGAQLSRYNNLATGRHIVTNGPVPPSAHLEGSFGLLAGADEPNTRMVYSCRNGEVDYFLAHDCGTYTNLGSVGRLYISPPAGVPAQRVYRCLIPGFGHFASLDPGCEGQTTEFELGYTRGYLRLVRHITTGYPYDHASSTGRIAANYRPEGSTGTLSIAQLPGTTALMSCQDGTDTFSSTDAACEGKTVVGRIGFIWTSPPQGLPGAPGATGKELFRCRASWNELFDSGDPACEGQTLDRSLGFVASGL
ncbi:LamG-like jellyroll fold domain-containing protein [Nonomuraea sp. NPDC050022]|uniref:LamG-like jellyroll fold domain-containing protein n=1 Tax=Nonomuraea sp. NPDC050022 TaxID=3364358 RepID=UPI0037A712BC